MSDVVSRASHLLEGITEGPWTWDEWPNRNEIGSPDGQLLAITPSVLAREQSSLDARFLAEARQLVPDLVAEVERLRAELTRQSPVENRSQHASPPQRDPHSTAQCCEHWPTVTICGSMRFYHQMLTVAEELTLDGFIVLTPFVRKHEFMEADVNHPGNVVEKLDAQHKRKIDLASGIVVVSDETGYYGDSTRSEIAYAQSHFKTVAYRRISLKHTCAGHPGDACSACRAAKQRVGRPRLNNNSAEGLSTNRVSQLPDYAAVEPQTLRTWDAL